MSDRNWRHEVEASFTYFRRHPDQLDRRERREYLPTAIALLGIKAEEELAMTKALAGIPMTGGATAQNARNQRNKG